MKDVPWNFAPVFNMFYTVDGDFHDHLITLSIDNFELPKDNGRFLFLKVKPGGYRLLGIYLRKNDAQHQAFKKIILISKRTTRILIEAILIS